MYQVSITHDLVHKSVALINSTANDKINPDYNTHPELVRPELIDVGALSGYRLIPEAELQQELVPARQQHLTPLLPVRCEFLPMDGHQSISFTSNPGCTTKELRRLYLVLSELVHHLCQSWVSSSVTPQMNCGNRIYHRSQITITREKHIDKT